MCTYGVSPRASRSSSKIVVRNSTVGGSGDRMAGEMPQRSITRCGSCVTPSDG
jgi:hypothetical protein